MYKPWLVARHQYTTMVGKRSFILVTLGFPLLIAAVMAIAIVFGSGRQDRRPVGYVDQADVLIPGIVDVDLELRREALDLAAAPAPLVEPAIKPRHERPAQQAFGDEPTCRGVVAPVKEARRVDRVLPKHAGFAVVIGR